MVASILKIGISQNTNYCDNLVGFPKSGYILHPRIAIVSCFHTFYIVPTNLYNYNIHIHVRSYCGLSISN